MHLPVAWAAGLEWFWAQKGPILFIPRESFGVLHSTDTPKLGGDAVDLVQPGKSPANSIALRILGLSMAGVRALHSRGPGPQNPICLRARILRVERREGRGSQRVEQLQPTTLQAAADSTDPTVARSG